MFLNRFDHLQELKPGFSFLVNPFNVSVVGDGGPVSQPFVTNLSALDMKLIDMQEDQCKNSVSATLQLPSGDRFQKVNTHN